MTRITEVEHQLWHASDQLRANSTLTAAEYCQPVLGLIFLCYIQRRFNEVFESLALKNKKRPGEKQVKNACAKRNVLYIPDNARLEKLLAKSDQDLGEAFNHAMQQLESEYPILEKKLPRDYEKLDAKLLRHLLDTIDHSILHSSQDDVFGRIYEYFLGKFAMTSAQEGGEFFTPMCLVQTIVEILKPSHGIVFDPACGSGGMFVQTNYYVKRNFKDQKCAAKIQYFGQEKTEYSTRLCYMNVVVHNLNATIEKVNTFYQDSHQLIGQCDFVMANPPFNVDGVIPEKIKNDTRLVFGLPPVSKKSGFISNANFLWIQYFYSYLNKSGKAGFVMTTSAPDARGKELDIIKELIDTDHINAIILVGNKFFYTRPIACTLWFFDKAKPKPLKNKILMISAKNIYRKVTNRLHDFSPEQITALAAIADLSRGESRSFIVAVKLSLMQCLSHLQSLSDQIHSYIEVIEKNKAGIKRFKEALQYKSGLKHLGELADQLDGLEGIIYQHQKNMGGLISNAQTLAGQYALEQMDDLTDLERAMAKVSNKLSEFYDCSTDINRVLNELIEALFNNKSPHSEFDISEGSIKKIKIDMAKQYTKFVEQTKPFNTAYQHVHWLLSCFPDARYQNVSGLCCLVDKERIEANDWSLNPQRYVGDVSNESQMTQERIDMGDLLSQFKQLTVQSSRLTKSIVKNLEDYLQE